MAASDLAALVERLEKVTSRLEKVSIKGGGSGAAVEDGMFKITLSSLCIQDILVNIRVCWYCILSF